MSGRKRMGCYLSRCGRFTVERLRDGWAVNAVTVGAERLLGDHGLHAQRFARRRDALDALDVLLDIERRGRSSRSDLVVVEREQRGMYKVPDTTVFMWRRNDGRWQVSAGVHEQLPIDVL